MTEREMERPVEGGTAAHNCNPPCELMRMEAHAEKRRKMTKAELLRDAELSDEAWINLSTEAEMQTVYADTMRRAILHLLALPTGKFLWSARAILRRAVHENEFDVPQPATPAPDR